MLFEKQPPLKLIKSPSHKGKFSLSGGDVGRFVRGKFLYYGESFSRYHVRVRRAEKWLDIFRITGALVFGGGMWTLFFWYVDKTNLWEILGTYSFWFEIEEPMKALFWLGVIAFSYLWYRVSARRRPIPEIEEEGIENGIKEEKEETVDKIISSWSEAKKLPRKKQIDISRFFTKDAHMVLENAFTIADKYNNKEVTLMHVFYSLLDDMMMKSIFVRLGIPSKVLYGKVGQTFLKGKESNEPRISDSVYELIFRAYDVAVYTRDNHVRTTALIVATVNQSEELQELLYDFSVDKQKLTNVIEWARIREKLREQYLKFRKAAVLVSKHGMDRAMTAVATPFLNAISQDLTIAAKFGHLAPCVARDKEIDEIFRIIRGGQQNVILVGEHGVGKMSIIEGVVQRMISGDAPEKLKDKRLVQISTSALLAGTTVSGAQERMIRLMNEVHRARNVILFINNLHDLTGMADTQGEGLDISETIAEFLGDGSVTMFATTLPESYNRYIVNTEVGTVFSKVEVREMDENQAIQVLESKVGSIEYKQNIFFSYSALEQCVKLAMKFLHDRNLPDSAITLLTEVASYVKNKKGENQLVTEEDVGHIVSEKTGIPSTFITEGESQKLLRLEDEMHKRMVGQNMAVELVANALRRARAEIRSQKRPIANFLFLGPTGVGKTELAKTIAEVYFGGENMMIRIDMSEYQDKSGIYRLIGQPGQQGTGLLTEAVRKTPFSLILLDEMEKADPNILNLFLQVFDDGRLTDSTGRVVDFTNTIIIATSNAGTSFVQEQINKDVDMETIREQLIRGELKQYYRPEFLNRFDGIVLFKALNREEIKQIAGLMLKRVAKDLAIRGIELRVEDAALDVLSQVGFDPEFGARPMRRAIQDRVENQLAEFIIQGMLKRRDVIVLGEECEMRIERK